MTPLGASLAFVTLSIIISSIRHFIFPSNNLSSSQQSSIQIKKLYTLSDRKPQVQVSGYKSFYEAYYQFHANEQQQYGYETKKEHQEMLKNYNSMVLKESLINDQHTLLCDENFLVTIQQGIKCQETDNNSNRTISSKKKPRCDWTTELNIYQLPFLKKQTKQTFVLQGRIGLSKSTAANQLKNSIQCKKMNNRDFYLINFPLSYRENNLELWRLYDLYIFPLKESQVYVNQTIILKNTTKKQQSQIQNIDSEQEEDQDEKKKQKKKSKKKNLQIKSKKPKKKKQRDQSKIQAQQKDNNNKESSSKQKKQKKAQKKNFFKNSQTKLFQTKLILISLMKKNDRPQLHFSDGYCVAYTSSQQPWIIRYNCDQEWQQINILQKQIQDKVYQKLNLTQMSPPFEAYQGVNPKYLFTFDSVQKTYKQNCEVMQKYSCLQEMIHESKNYLTFIYMHTNNQYRVQKFYVQLTFIIGSVEQRFSVGNEPQLKEDQQYSLESFMKEQDTQNAFENSDINQGQQTPDKINFPKKQSKKNIEKQKLIDRYPTSYSRLFSHSIVISELNPNRKMRTDCQLHSRVKNYYERYFDKYYWLYENRRVGSVQVYSLICVIVFDLDESFRVTEIDDIIHSPQPDKKIQKDYVDWKTLKKKINYEEQFEKQLKLKAIQMKKIQAQNLLKQKQAIQKAQLQLKISEELNDNNTCNSTSGNCSDIVKQRQKLQIKKKVVKNPSKKQDKQQNDDEGIEQFNILESLKDVLFFPQDEDVDTLFQQGLEEKLKKIRKDKKRKKKDKFITSKTIKRKQNKLIIQRDNSNNSLQDQQKRKSNQKNPNMTLLSGSFRGSLNSTAQGKSIFSTNSTFPYRSKPIKFKFPLPFLLSFANNLQIISADFDKPLILFSGVKQHLFTYTHKEPQNNRSGSIVVDYRYMPLSSSSTARLYYSLEASSKKQIKTAKQVTEGLLQSDLKQNVKIQINDQTHPFSQNVIREMYHADQKILHQIKSIKSISVQIPKSNSQSVESVGQVEVYRRYVVVAWGWGLEVYEVNWDKNGFYSERTQDQISSKFAERQSGMIQYFIPFINLFATFYCMFQALISSR